MEPSCPQSLGPLQLQLLERWYERGKLVGGIGSDSLEEILEIACNYIDVITGYFSLDVSISVLDIGSGVGVPGLPMALLTGAWKYVLLDSMVRRTRVSSAILHELGIDQSVEVITGRAEEIIRERIGSFDVVTARCFISPPLFVELAGPFVRPGGILVVSEPPMSIHESRWGREALEKFGIEYPVFVEVRGRHYAVLRVLSVDRRKLRAYPLMLKRPLWHSV